MPKTDIEARIKEIEDLLSLNLPCLDRLNPEYAKAVEHIDFLLSIVKSQPTKP